MHFSSHHYIILTEEGRKSLKQGQQTSGLNINITDLSILSQLKSPITVLELYKTNETSEDKDPIKFQEQLNKFYNYGFIKKIDKKEVDTILEKENQEIDLTSEYSTEEIPTDEEQAKLQNEFKNVLNTIKQHHESMADLLKDKHITVGSEEEKILKEAEALIQEGNYYDDTEHVNEENDEDNSELDFLQDIDLDDIDEHYSEEDTTELETENLSPEIDDDMLDELFIKPNKQNSKKQKKEKKETDENTTQDNKKRKQNHLLKEINRLKELKKIAEMQEIKRKEFLAKKAEEEEKARQEKEEQEKAFKKRQEEQNKRVSKPNNSMTAFLKKREIQKRNKERNKEKSDKQE